MDISFLFKLGYYMLKLIYYVPGTHLESTKSAIFNAGGGGIGNYEHCAWQVLGTGQFKPVKAAHPFMGQLDVLEKHLHRNQPQFSYFVQRYYLYLLVLMNGCDECLREVRYRR